MLQNQPYTEKHWGPYYALLFRATKYRPDDTDREKIRRLIQSGINWEILLNLARCYDVISLLYYCLREPCWKDIIPGVVLASLKDEYAAVCGLNLAYYNELERLLGVLAEQKVEVMLLKGAALAQLLYPDIVLRAFGDVDLLVHPEHLGQIHEIMQPDYQLENPLPAARLMRKCYFHLTYKRKLAPNLSFEFHWNLYSAEDLIDFNANRLWQGARYIDISSAKALVPSLENLFLHLCLHFSGHWFLSLKDLWDVEWIVSSPENIIDWEQIMAVVKASGIATRVYYTLYFANKLLGTDIEPHIWQALTPPALTRRLFPLILDEQKLLCGEAELNKDSRGMVSFFLYQDKWFKFLKRLLYPGVCWLTIYPDEPYINPLTIKLKTLLRGIRLFFYIIGRFTISLIRSLNYRVS